MADLRRLPGPWVEAWQWQRYGACRKVDPELFFPADGERGPAYSHREQVAKAICAGCMVRVECRAYALQAQEPHGIWGGLSTGEREAIQTAAAADQVCA